MFNTPSRRCGARALVGVGDAGAQTPVLCVELQPGIAAESNRRVIADELRAIATRLRAHRAASSTFLFHPGFPVDIRHNAKIGREQLAAWAAKTLQDAG